MDLKFRKIFNKSSKDTISNANSVFTNEPPITGGNSFETKKILQIQEDIDLNNLSVNTNIVSNKVKELKNSTTYNEWLLLNFHANYFINNYRVRTDSQVLNDAIYKCFRVHFLWGNCGIYKIGNQIVPIYEKKTVLNNSGLPIKIEAQLIHEMIATQSLTPKTKTKLTIQGDELLNYARLPLTSIGFGGVVTWLPFVKQQQQMLDKIYMYSYLFTKKIGYNVNDPSAMQDDLKLFFSDIPFLMKIDAISNVGNSFEWLGVQGGSSVSVDEIIKYYKFVCEEYYKLLGRRFNVDAKEERNLIAEIEASQANFDVLENEDRIIKRDFMNRVKELFGVDWYEI